MAYSKKPKTTLKEAEELTLAKSQFDAHTRARDNGHEEYIHMAKKCDAYYRGEQWDDFDMQMLDDQGRPALTINTILPTINAVLAEQSSKKADIQFKPRGGGEQNVADVLTQVYAYIADNNKLDWVEQQVFSDGLIQDRGYFDVRVDFEEHVQGEIKIEAKDPLDILIDPDAMKFLKLSG